MKIAEKNIGDDYPTFIVAELSANHCQRLDIAIKTLEAMKSSGADAVKFQIYTPDIITIDSKKPPFIVNNELWKGKSLYELYQEAYTPWEWVLQLEKVAWDCGLIPFASPFDETAVDFIIEKTSFPVIKIASPEITDIPLIEYIASKGLPIIFSTGIATLSEIETVMNICKEYAIDEVGILKCTSAYPTPLEDVNLNNIKTLRHTFKTVVGLSDHTKSVVSIPSVAVALGARIIEKHFILDKNLPSVDAAISLNPEEFKQMVTGIRNIEKALGSSDFVMPESSMRSIARSLFVVEDIKENEIFTKENVKSKRPNIGMHPQLLEQILGMNASKDINKNTPLTFDLIKN